MNNYERPVVMVNDGLAEGVFAASGEPECWTIDVVSVQDWNGSHHVYEVRCTHSDTVEHISSATTVTVTFNQPLTDAYSEFDCTYSGSTATVTRTLLGDSYKSGDNMTYKIWAKAADEATTKSLAVVGATISCTHQTNVQGKYD